MKTLQLTSHYFGFSINIKMEDSKAERLLNSDNPMDEIYTDIERIRLGYAPFYITPSQGRRIKNFFSKDNREGFDKVKINQ